MFQQMMSLNLFLGTWPIQYRIGDFSENLTSPRRWTLLDGLGDLLTSLRYKEEKVTASNKVANRSINAPLLNGTMVCLQRIVA